jgi:trehalose utilization protein
MSNYQTRRTFLRRSGTAAGSAFLPGLVATAHALAAEPKPAKAVQVVMWDEQQPAQKEVYDNFLGNWIAKYLKAQPGLTVKSAKLSDPEQGLSKEILGPCDVLIWWGHQRHKEIVPKTGKRIVERIKAGTLSLIALHSAHWSTPFVVAMHEKTRLNVERLFPTGDKTQVQVNYLAPPQQYTVPKVDARLTPCFTQRKFPSGLVKVTVHLPICCFPAYRADGKPSYLRVLKPDHPIVKGIPEKFELPHTEMYDEPFHVPEPDELILEERWAGGEWFRSGAVWKIGKGRVFYFRPGHETYAVYKEKIPLKILDNAVRWLAASQKEGS